MSKIIGGRGSKFSKNIHYKWDNSKSTLSIVIKKIRRYSRIVLLLVIRWMNMIKYLCTVKRFKMFFMYSVTQPFSWWYSQDVGGEINSL